MNNFVDDDECVCSLITMKLKSVDYAIEQGFSQTISHVQLMEHNIIFGGIFFAQRI